MDWRPPSRAEARKPERPKGRPIKRNALLIVSLWLAPAVAAPADELPRAKPGAVGLSAAKLTEPEGLLQRLVDDGKVAGGVALVARHGKVAVRRAVRLPRPGGPKTPMTEDTIFAIASMTKPVTCVAAMTLVERGKLGLDDPVANVPPRAERPARAGRCPGRHGGPDSPRSPRSGRSRFATCSRTPRAFAYGGSSRPTPARQELMSGRGCRGRASRRSPTRSTRLARVPLAHQPGEGWTYGLSHDVLGRVIEVVSGQPLDDYLQERIFDAARHARHAFPRPRGEARTGWRRSTGRACGRALAAAEGLRLGDVLLRAAGACSRRPATTPGSPRCSATAASSTAPGSSSPRRSRR